MVSTRYQTITRAMVGDDFDFTLKGSRHIRALALGLAITKRDPGQLMKEYASRLCVKKDSVYRACFYALQDAGSPWSVMESIRFYAAVSILEGAVYRG